MSNDLRKAISDARRAVKGIPSKTLLGKRVYPALDAAEEALRRGDTEGVRQELKTITGLLTQS